MQENKFVGCWVSILPHDSDDYVVEYSIDFAEGQFQISAKDLQDGECMNISNIKFSNDALIFDSYMESTERFGKNKFMLNGENKIVSEFTFTTKEELKRI